MKKLLLFSLLFFFLFVSSASATSIWSSNLAGVEKNTFFTNESIYVTSGNISNATTNSLTVRIYIANNSNSWSNNTALSDVTGGYTVVSTNSSGYITPRLIWDTPSTGTYDIVADVNLDGNYTTNIDYVDNLTTTGFSVVAAPVPTLTVSKGPHSPSDHTWNLTNTSDNVMLQLKLEASNEDVRIDTIALSASGSGDDENGVKLLRLIRENNNNSVFDTGESLIGYGIFARDNGLLTLSLVSDNIVSSGSIVYMIFIYTMDSDVSEGDTFSFSIIDIGAVGATSGDSATISGLAITSAVKTISGAPSQPVVLCSDYTNQTSCLGADCNWCNATSTCINATESCPTCSGTVSLVLEEHGNTSTAKISGLSDCDDKTAYLKIESCSGSTVDTCFVSGTGCWISFSTPLAAGNYTYFACVDMDGNGEFTSDESTSSVLMVSEEEEAAGFAVDLNTIILIIAIVALVASVAFAIFWFTRVRQSKPYQFEFKS